MKAIAEFCLGALIAAVLLTAAVVAMWRCQ